MRLLHTSDWHIGRTFHGHSTDDHLAQVLAAIADLVRANGVDAVVVAGDVFDSSTPKADAFTMLNAAIHEIRRAGAAVVLTSGNHDGPARLGHMAEFASFGGVHVLTDLKNLARPVTFRDEHGPIHLYGIPYVHPEFLRAAYDGFDGGTHADALSFAMDLVRDDAAARHA
uniref:metallophosphoesterase family protein n=1 Tax=Demequina sp. TaxID=2050685 RepID=UPI0025E2BD76